MYLRGGPHYLAAKTEGDTIRNHQHMVTRVILLGNIAHCMYKHCFRLPGPRSLLEARTLTLGAPWRVSMRVSRS